MSSSGPTSGGAGAPPPRPVEGAAGDPAPAAAAAPAPAAPVYVYIKRAGIADEVFAEVPCLAVDTVARLAARACTMFPQWGVYPGQVLLLLVPHAPGSRKPSAEAEAHATPLDEPSMPLAEAGVLQGSWLLARVPLPAFIVGLGATAAASALLPLQASSFRDAFVQLLKAAGIHARADVLARLQGANGNVFLTAATPSEAAHWYAWAEALPLSPTRGRFKSSSGYMLNGPLSTASASPILLAYDAEGGAALFKVVRSGDGGEVAAATAISGGPGIVSSRFLSAPREDGSDFYGLLMRKYERSLDAAPDVVLSETVLLHCAETLLGAVRHVHACGFVHMDIKEANIFVDAAGEWALGDFGSAVREGEPIASTTRGLHPVLARWMLARPPILARRTHDLYMALGLLVRQLDAPMMRSHLYGEEGPSAEELAARTSRVSLEALRTFLFDLLREATVAGAS